VRRTFSLRMHDYIHFPEGKLAYNERMFTEIAPRYDFITRALSLGRDGAWKRRLVAMLPDVAAPVCLDLACGTGDLTFGLARRYLDGRIVGLDLTEAMLDRARRRNRFGERVAFVRADMCETGLADGSVDVVTGGYALRNAPTVGRAVREIARVCKPGGTAALLDFSKPTGRAGRWLEYWLLRTWGDFWGWALHGNGEVYGYIAESLRQFPDRERLRAMFEDAGFEPVAGRRYYLGVTEVLVFRRRAW